MQSIVAHLIIIEEADSRRIVDANTTAERSIANWRLTFNVGGVSFDLATAHGQDTTEVADAFAARLRLALAQGLT